MLNQTSCLLPPSPRQPPPVSTVGVSGLSCTSVCAGVSPRAELGTHGGPVYAYSRQWHLVTVRTGVGATGSRAETSGTTDTRQSSEWTGPSHPRAFSSGAPGWGWVTVWVSGWQRFLPFLRRGSTVIPQGQSSE